MNRRLSIRGTVVAVLLLPVAAFAQAFQDLDFEQAKLVTSYDWSYPYSVVFSNAFPHWQATVQGSPITSAYYDAVALDYNTVGIYDANPTTSTTHWPNAMPDPPMFGQYSAYLSTEFAGAEWPADAELAQTGLIPSTARSIRFATTPYALGGSLTEADWQLTFSVNGQAIPYVAIDTETNYVMWAADISAFTGTVSEIRFAQQSGDGVAVGLDNISFSSQVIPEPGTLTLVFWGMGLLVPVTRGFKRATRPPARF